MKINKRLGNRIIDLHTKTFIVWCSRCGRYLFPTPTEEFRASTLWFEVIKRGERSIKKQGASRIPYDEQLKTHAEKAQGGC